MCIEEVVRGREMRSNSSLPLVQIFLKEKYRGGEEKWGWRVKIPGHPGSTDGIRIHCLPLHLKIRRLQAQMWGWAELGRHGRLHLEGRVAVFVKSSPPHFFSTFCVCLPGTCV